MHLAIAFLLFAAGHLPLSPAHGIGRPLITLPPPPPPAPPCVATATCSANVSNTAELKAAMANSRVNDIVLAAGVHRLAEEPGLDCSPDPINFFLCIGHDLTIRAAAGAKVVLDGGGQKGVIYIKHGWGVWPAGRITGYLQGLEITNGNASGIGVGGTLVLTNSSVYDNVVRTSSSSSSSLHPTPQLALIRAPTGYAPAAPPRPAGLRHRQ